MRFVIVSLLLGVAAPAWAASPTLARITPRGAQRGTETVLTFGGTNLADAQEILFYTPGFHVTKLEPAGDQQVKATVKIAADCTLGEHAMRVRTASGISYVRTFWVGPLPVMDEKRPNNEFDKPMKVPFNVTIDGTVPPEGACYFQVEAKKGQRITAEVEGMRLANVLFDPFLAILDEKRFELATSDDAPMLGLDAAVSVVAPADGNYFIQVRESAYGAAGYQYRLHIGNFPRPQAVVPAGGKMGEEVEVRFIGDPGGEIKQKFRLPSQPQNRFGLNVADAGGLCPSPVPFRLSEFGNTIEVEPNDTPETATRGELPNALNGIIEKMGDIDTFRFAARKGQSFEVNCWARRLGSSLDPIMTLLTADGKPLAANDDTGGPDSYFRFNVPADGDYLIRVTDHLGKGGPSYFYRVEFTQAQPRLEFSIPKVANYSQDRQTIAVPRGNRYAALFNASRVGFGGDLVIEPKNLPLGVKFETENVAANMTVVPVVFEAAPEAPLAGTLADISGRPLDTKIAVTGEFTQNTELVVANPGQSIYWALKTSKAAVAVTEAAPFKLQLIEPKVPLVNDGTMQLKIVAQRQKDFKAPITVQMLYNPPGVGSASSATIAEGQNETYLTINANAGAAARKYRIAVIGQAPVVNGPLWVSSQLATLEVAPPLLVFTMQRAAAEQGQNTAIPIKIQHATPFEGKAKVKLIGLPPKVEAPELEITKETTELEIPLTLDKASPVGQHRNLFCQVIVMQNGEPIVHSTGKSELRIDAPLPAKVAVTPTPAKPTTPTATQPTTAPPKRLSRLEQLRLEQQEREKNGGAAPATPEKK
jgi:hypothetical protein